MFQYKGSKTGNTFSSLSYTSYVVKNSKSCLYTLKDAANNINNKDLAEVAMTGN